MSPSPIESSPLWSVRMANSVIERAVPYKWHYEYGLIHKSFERVWQQTGDTRFYDVIFREVSPLIQPDGSIETYTITEYNLDQIYAGRLLFLLYRTTGEERFKKAMALLRTQLAWQPRTRAGGFWHKLIYPHQMWLDGIYMASPFFAEYAVTFGETQSLNDIVQQFRVIEDKTRDPQTGLLYHGWDESRLQRWANPQTGCSPHCWGRATGWYAMALVEVLELLPGEFPGRAVLLAILERLAAALLPIQDAASGLWYQVMDQSGREDNYLEASGSCMAAYSFAKAARLGYLNKSYLDHAKRAYAGILEHFVKVDERGQVHLERVCGAAGLGGTPYRDGTYHYYVTEKIITDDYKGVGAFILASCELESL
jgi:unsaturated rhamnogalacturonyl hydrolase